MNIIFFKFLFAFNLNSIIYLFGLVSNYYFLEHSAALPIIFNHFQ